jgi:hypothetical protein
MRHGQMFAGRGALQVLAQARFELADADGRHA